MQLTDYVDCLIPRGGPALIASIREHATVPVIIDGDGNCQIYVDASADQAQRVDIVVNAKTQRPGVCNAAETLLVHDAIADEFLPRVAAALRDEGVELVGDDGARARVADMGVATDDDFATEFLALKLSVGVVPSLDAAIEHVNRFSSGHTEAILTRGPRARRGASPTRSTRPRSSSTPRRGSPTARSSGSAPRSASRPRSSTPVARWDCNS